MSHLFHRTSESNRPTASRRVLIRGMVLLWSVTFIFGSHSPPRILADVNQSTPCEWNLIETDCTLNETGWQQRRHQFGDREVHTFRYRCGPGTRILVASKIPAAFVIPELSVALQVRSKKPGAQLLVRVVLPYSDDGEMGQPITTYLVGADTQTTDGWETLRMEPGEIHRKLERQLWVLRRQHGAHISLRNAYIDQVVVNIHGQGNENQVTLAAPRIDGVISAEAIAERVRIHGALTDRPLEIRDDQVQRASATEPIEDKQPSYVTRDGTVLLLRGKPFFARIIQHNGEPFSFLRDIGFNTIQLRAPATPDQLEQAEQLDLWLICPPPSSIGIHAIPFAYDRVLCWSVGEKLSANNAVPIGETVREIQQSDLREGRPVMGHVQSHWSLVGRHLDITLMGLEPLGSSFLCSRYNHWLSDRAELIGNRIPWADIQTEFHPDLRRQSRGLAGTLPPTPIEPQQIQFLIYEAICGGARGMRFLSRSRLDGNDPVSRLRAITLTAIIDELRQLEPWIAGGAVRGVVPADAPGVEVTAVDTARSRLLLVQRPTHREQYWAGDVPPSTVVFRDPSASFTDRAYQITPAGLQPLETQREPAGLKLVIENCPMATAIVLTQNAQVLNRLNTPKLTNTGSSSPLVRQMDLARQWLAIMQLVENQCGQMNHSSPAASGALNEAVNAFRQATRLQTTGSDQISLKYINRTQERLAFVRRELMSEAIGDFSSKVSTPLLTHVSLVPLHWRLVEALRNSTWAPNALAGGDFEDLEHAVRAGWVNRRLDLPGVSTRVELSRAAAVQGTYGLEMNVTADNSITVIESPPVWITSAPVPVSAGHLVRVHGWVNIPNVLTRTEEGLIIRDNLTGMSMAERIPITDGWQEFTLYRFVERDGPFTLTFEMAGAGTVRLDEVTVRTMPVPDGSVRQARNN